MHENRTVDLLSPLVEPAAALTCPGDEVDPVAEPGDGPAAPAHRPPYGPRATRVRRPASFWVSHCVGLILGTGCVVGLVLGSLFLHWTLRGDTSASGGADPAMAAPPGYTDHKLIFDDQFTGTKLNTTRWNTHLGARGIVWNNHGRVRLPFSAPNVPGTGTESAMFGPRQVSVDNGLTLTAQRNSNGYADTYPWISGVVTTGGRRSLPSTGWYVQVKAKMPDMRAGMWPAIWFMPDTPSSPGPEMDLFEGGWLGANPNEIMHVDYGGGSTEYANYRDIVYNTRSELAAGYHVYGIQYIPNVSVEYFLDGKLVFQQLESNRGGVVSGSYEMLMELQVADAKTSWWHSVPTASTPAASMDIAEVRAYSLVAHAR